MTFDEFLAIYEADDNEWWRSSCGDHQNWFEEAVDRWRGERERVDQLDARLQERDAEVEHLRAALAIETTITSRYEPLYGHCESCGGETVHGHCVSCGANDV